MEVLFNVTMFFFINNCTKHLDDLATSSSLLEVDFLGLFGANEMMGFSTKFNGLLRKHVKSFGTPSIIMVGLSGSGH